MAYSKLLTTAFIYLIFLQFCYADYETIQRAQLTCTLASPCQKSFDNIDFTKYQSLILEVELENNSIPSDSSIQIFQGPMSLLISSPSQVLIKNNRVIFSIPVNSQIRSNNLIFFYNSISLFPISSTFKFSLNLQGILLNTSQNYPCPFNCSGTNGQCNSFDGQCSCQQNFKGVDCGQEAKPINLLLDQEYQTYQLNAYESSLFFVNSDQSFSISDVFYNILAKSSDCVDYIIYGGLFDLKVISSGNVCNIMENASNIKIDVSNQVSQYQNIVKFTNSNSFKVNMDLKFYKSEATQENFVIDFSTQFGIIIICIIALICLVLILLIVLISRSVIKNHNEKKISQFQMQQKTIQIDTKIPNQKYSEVISKYPNIKEANECVICLDEFTDSSDVRLTPCFHIFHNDCFNSFAHRGKAFCCPVCRRGLQDGEQEVFDYKLKMQASHTIQEDHENQQTHKSSEENQTEANQQNQPLPKTAINSNHCLNEESNNTNQVQAPQEPQNKIEGAVIINIQNPTDQYQTETNELDTQTV